MVLNNISQRCALRIAVGITLMVLLLAGGAGASTITVNASGGANYTKIQDAINNASNGDTILVYSGTYFENLIIDNKTLTLKGINYPVINTSRSWGNAVFINYTAQSNIIDGFTITGLSSGYNGINILSNNNIIKNNIISNSWQGIVMYSTYNNTLFNNSLTGNRYGLGVYYGYYHNIDTSNKINGKPILYLLNAQDRLIDATSDPGYLGIVNSRNITVRGITMKNNSQGILLANSLDSRIENVVVINNLEGIHIASSNDVIVNNNASNNNVGIFTWGAYSNSISNNILLSNYEGIELSYSTDNVLTYNTINSGNYGINVYGWKNNYRNSIDTSNTFNGKPIYYYYNVSNSDISDLLTSSLTVVASDNVTIRDNNVNGGDGIHLAYVNNSLVSNNLISDNAYGIEIDWNSYNNNVISNNVSYNKWGNVEVQGYDNKISNNIVSNDGSVYIYGSNNSILSNNISNYSQGIFVSGSNNRILSNYISNHSGGIQVYGGWLSGGFNNTILGNNISNYSQGIFVSGSNNRVLSNYISNHSGGIQVYMGWPSGGSNNSILGNYVVNYSGGISVSYGPNNNISGNIVSGNVNGISMDWNSFGNIFMDNIITNNTYGLQIYSQAPNNSYFNNTISKNTYGLQLYSPNTTLSNINISDNKYGLTLSNTYNNTLRNISLNNNSYGFNIWGWELKNYIHDIDISNKINGKPIYYLVNQTSDTISQDAGFIGLVNSRNIILESLTTYGILFAYTNDSRIENVSVYNSSGIVLKFSNNNSIANSRVSNSDRGVDLSSSSNNILEDNILSNNERGITSDWPSNSNNIINNTISNSQFAILLNGNNNNLDSNSALNNAAGIVLGNSNNNTVSRNNASDNELGISLLYSGNDTFKNNSMKNNTQGFNVFGTSLPFFLNNIDSSNTINNKPIQYIVNENNRTIEADVSYVGVINSSNITIRNIEPESIILAYTNDSKIENATISSIHMSSFLCDGCLFNGLLIDSSFNNTIKNSSVFNKSIGLALSGSDNNTISGNSVYDNLVGIYLIGGSKYNSLYHNNLINNTYQNQKYNALIESGWNNSWDSGYPSGGNYWSDYTGFDLKGGPNQDILGSDGIGDTPYNISGSANARDNYPFMNPNGWNSAITSQPVISNLSPENNTHLGSNNVLLTWNTQVNSTTEVYLKSQDETNYTHYTGDSGLLHTLIIDNFTRNKWYYYYVISGSATSEQRSFYIDNGIEFSQKSYNFTIDRDYSQLVSVSVINTDSKQHTLLVSAYNPYSDLIFGFIGNGSQDQEISLNPGESEDVTLSIFAQDAMLQDYSFPITLNSTDSSLYDSAMVNLKIRQPNINYTVTEIGADPYTLVKTFSVTNNGDRITDFSIFAEGDLANKVLFKPAISHANIGSGESFTFKLIPLIESDTPITGNINATGAGKHKLIAVNFSQSGGKTIYTSVLSNITICIATNSWYCTNRPDITNTLYLPPGFNSTDVKAADLAINFTLPWSADAYRDHNVSISLNGHPVKNLNETIPSGLYLISIDPSYLNYGSNGTGANRIDINTRHLPGGHYVVATNIELRLKLNNLTTKLFADSQDQADNISKNTDFLCDKCVPRTGITSIEPYPASGSITVTGSQNATFNVSVGLKNIENGVLQVEVYNGSSLLTKSFKDVASTPDVIENFTLSFQALDEAGTYEYKVLARYREGATGELISNDFCDIRDQVSYKINAIKKESTVPPTIFTWNNSKTNNTASDIAINASEFITLNASVNQPVKLWNWFVNGINQNNNKNNISINFPNSGFNLIQVNATNDNGTSNTVSWAIWVGSSKTSVNESIMFIDYYPIFEDEPDNINLTSSHDIWVKANIPNVGLKANSTTTGKVYLQILNVNGDILWNSAKDGTIYLTVDSNDLANLTVSIKPDSNYLIPDIPELYGGMTIRFIAVPSLASISAIDVNRSVYISPYDMEPYENSGSYFYKFSYSRKANGNSPIGIIASPEYEQYIAYNASYNNTNKSYDITIPAFIAHEELIGLTELAKKYPDAEVVIFPNSTNDVEMINQIKWVIENFKNKNQIPLIVGMVPHNHVSYNSLSISEAYKASYMSYAMAASVNNLITWDGDDQKVFVTNNFRSDEMSKPLIPKYSKDSTQLSGISKYPAVIMGRTNLPFLQIAPTLSTKEIKENGSFNKNYSIYRVGPLVPIEHTYYLGASASVPLFSVSLNPKELSLNLGLGVTLPGINKNVGLSFSLIGGKDGLSGSVLLGLWQYTGSLDHLLNDQHFFGTIAGLIPDVSKKLMDFNNAIQSLFTSLSTGYQQSLVQTNTENILEPSGIFTILKTTVNDIGSSPQPVYNSVNLVRETYPLSILGENFGLSGLAAISSLTQLAKVFGVTISPSLTGSAEVGYYTGITDDVNFVILNDDLNNIKEYPFTYKEYPTGELNGDTPSFKQGVVLFKWMYNVPIKAYIEQKLTSTTNLNEGVFKGIKLSINAMINDYTGNHNMLEILKSRIIDDISSVIHNSEGLKIDVDPFENLFGVLNAAGVFSETFSESMEAAKISTQELYYFGDPTATGYDDPLNSTPPVTLPTKFNIQLISEPLTLNAFNSTFIFTNLTNITDPNIMIKTIISSYGPSTGYPQIPMMTLIIQSPANQTIDKINATFQNSTSLENITLPMTVINIGGEPVPGVITNISHWPLEEWDWGSNTVGNTTYSVINLFPFQYDTGSHNGTYYKMINISVTTKIVEPVYKTVKIEAYPNIISLGPNSEIKDSLKIFNDYTAKVNSSNLQIKAEIPDGIEINNTDGILSSNSGKTVVNWNIPELRNDPYNYSKFLHLTMKSPNEISNMTISTINVTASYVIDNETEETNLSIPIILVPPNLVDIEVKDLNVPNVLYVNNSFNISSTILNNGTSTVAMIPVRLYLDEKIVESKTIDKLNPQENRTIYFNFTPEIQGKFNITSAAVRAPSEVNIENNIITKEVDIVANNSVSSITNLSENSIGVSWINWTWVNPHDPNFSHVMIYLNGTFITNVSAPQNFYNITGLSPNTSYELETHTVDNSGNINETWVNRTARTLQTQDILSYYRSLGSNPNVVETTDLLKAADDWSNNVTPPGFTSPITTEQLLMLADEWSKSG